MSFANSPPGPYNPLVEFAQDELDMNLTDSVGTIPRVGPEYEKKLKKLGIGTVRDLLFHFPRTYQDLSAVTPIAQATSGEQNCIKGRVLDIKNIRTWKKKMYITEAAVEDESGSMRVTWFNQPYLTRSLKKGDIVYLVGKVARDKSGPYLQSPSHEKLSKDEQDATHAGRIIPVYAETAGVSSRWIRSIIKNVLQSLPDNLQDPLPADVLRDHQLPQLREALWAIHYPASFQDTTYAKKRFSFEELFYIMLFVLTERRKIATVKAHSVAFDEGVMKKFTDTLGFTLTNAQRKAAYRILKDIEKPRPMNRLVQGDVGSGKTVVAAMAALATAKGGFQVAIMAPTEILVQQHFKTFENLLSDFKLSIGLLTGKTDRYTSPRLKNDYIEVSRTKLIKMSQEGKIDVLVGTHSLIQDKVKFGKLALVIVDEQHRFGVAQRAKMLKNKDLIPHLLSMTATPIPRTLALTVYGDLDLTIIDELPKGRKQIETRIVSPKERDSAYEFIREQIEKGRQAFVICPRIAKSEEDEQLVEISEQKKRAMELKTVTEEYEKLSTEIFPDYNIEMLHGKIGQKEKEKIMRQMKLGKIDILVSTSVVEVGVDVPNATVMMIEGADRFGLSQLHQFRGRVGRGNHQSYCLLFTDSAATTTKQRLKAMVKSASGFDLAEEDLKIRGPGDFTGTKQWGMPDFVMQQLTNLPLVEQAREAAKSILEQDLSLRNHPHLKSIVESFRERLHLE